MEQSELSRLRSIYVAHPSCPTLLFCRKLIQGAFYDAAYGKTSDSENALTWLCERTDFSHAAIALPPELRRQFWGSFEWFCSWLDVCADRVLAYGLLRSSYDFIRSIRGLPDVYSICARDRRQWLRTVGHVVTAEPGSTARYSAIYPHP